MKKALLILAASLALASIADAQKPNPKSTCNYDKSKIPHYTLQDPLRFSDGRKVRNGKDWELRRAEILDIFQHEMYGQMPPASEIYLETLEEGVTLAGFGIRKQVRMWFRPDKTGPKVDWLIILPRHATGPVPAFISLNYEGNQTVLPDPEVLVTDGWLRDNPKAGISGHRIGEDSRGRYSGQSMDTTFPVGMILARGYAFVTACYGEISPDPVGKEEQDALAYTGIFELWGPRDPSRDDNTTSLGAWAWTLSRGLDMLERENAVDASKVVVTGYSRLAKAALVAGAFDQRFPVVVPVQTGGGGVPLAKHFFGENITTMTNAFTHWYCPAFAKYAGHEQEMPFDQHLFISCIAPRALLVEGFNSDWFDTEGEFLAVQAASPVWKKLKRGGMPQVPWPDSFDTSAIGDHLGYVRREEAHGIAECDWMWMLDFADKNLR